MARPNARPRFEAKEWNACGATQFYGRERKRSYIVEVTLSEAIRGDLLQQAVDKALQRLPYYGSTFVRKKGLYYYADNDLPLLVAESEAPRVIGGAITNYHMLDVTYWKNKISFAMFHGLCDGLGFNRFIEAVLYHYVCLKDGRQYSDEGIYTDRIPYDPAERADIHAERRKADIKKVKEMMGKEKRFRLPELLENKVERMYSLPLKVKTEDFLGWCKSNGASPAAGAAAIMTQAIARENEVRDSVIMSVVPISLRKALQVEKTFKNCYAAIFLPTAPEDARSLSTGELAAKLRASMKAQMSGEFAKPVCAGMNLLIQLGSKMPTYKLKTKAAGHERQQSPGHLLCGLCGRAALQRLRRPDHRGALSERASGQRCVLCADERNRRLLPHQLYPDHRVRPLLPGLCRHPGGAGHSLRKAALRILSEPRSGAARRAVTINRRQEDIRDEQSASAI